MINGRVLAAAWQGAVAAELVRAAREEGLLTEAAAEQLYARICTKAEALVARYRGRSENPPG